MLDLRALPRHFSLIVAAIGAGAFYYALFGAQVIGPAFARDGGTAGRIAFAFGPSLSAKGWKAVKFPRRALPRFTALGTSTLAVETSGGAGLLWRAVPAHGRNVNNARWRWQKNEGVGPTDLTRKGGDDRVLALYFVFADPGAVTEGADLPALLKKGRADVLLYVWGGDGNPGIVLPLPYFNGHGRMIVKRPANTKSGIWFNERAALRADFERAFRKKPGALVAIAVSSDADDTGGRNNASLGNLSLN